MENPEIVPNPMKYFASRDPQNTTSTVARTTTTRRPGDHQRTTTIPGDQQETTSRPGQHPGNHEKIQNAFPQVMAGYSRGIREHGRVAFPQVVASANLLARFGSKTLMLTSLACGTQRNTQIRFPLALLRQEVNKNYAPHHSGKCWRAHPVNNRMWGPDL